MIPSSVLACVKSYLFSFQLTDAAEHTKHYIHHPHYSFDFYIDIFNNVAQQIDSENNEPQKQGKIRCSKITGR